MVAAHDARRAQVPIPAEGDVDHRELQAVAPVDRQDLHRLRVGLQPSGPVGGLLDRVVEGVRGLVVEPVQQPGRTAPALALLGVQSAGDVPQVGEVALAVGPREHPRQ